MNKNMERFIESIESPSTFKVVKFVLKHVNDNDNIERYSLMELEQFVLDSKPSSPKAIITICYVLGMYAKWLKEQGVIDNDNFYRLIQSLDKKLLWKKAKPQAKKKFISYEQYKEAVHDIGMYEDFNALYYQSLFKCIYEGLYNDDMSVIKNLRKSDIGESIVLLREDNGHSYKLKISERLAYELKELADINIWERQNRFGTFEVDTKGVYPDSVFKVENRSRGASSEESYKFSYYNKLRKISKEYIDYGLPPFQLYVSGIMHRIKTELNRNNITLEEAFSEDNRNRTAYSIVSKELIRCNYESNIGNFREIVKGHLDVFN